MINLLPQRFQDKIIPEPMSGCWLWIGSRSKSGYGRIKYEGEARHAHRIIYEIIFGKLPKNIEACHRCDNPSCVNPDHIFPGTHSENIRDMIKKKRRRERLGEQNMQSKLKEFEVKEILSSKFHRQYLANKYRVSASLISQIRLRKAWKHLSEHKN